MSRWMTVSGNIWLRDMTEEDCRLAFFQAAPVRGSEGGFTWRDDCWFDGVEGLLTFSCNLRDFSDRVQLLEVRQWAERLMVEPRFWRGNVAMVTVSGDFCGAHYWQRVEGLLPQLTSMMAQEPFLTLALGGREG